MVRILFVSLLVSALLLVSVDRSAAQSNPQTDCQLRGLVVDFVASVQARALRNYTDWARSTFDALRLHSQCGYNYSSINYPTGANSVLDSTMPVTAPAADEVCDLEVFVDTANGDDDDTGSFSAPLTTIGQALAITRQRASTNERACITIRSGVYYLGNAVRPDPSTDSRRGAIHLTSADSNLTIRAYKNEPVTLSGGVQLDDLQWTSWQNGVQRAKLPKGLVSDWMSFNELYTDSKRAIRAKYPNGDPSTIGLYTNPSGWMDSAMGWTGPKTYGPVTNVKVQSPYREDVVFKYYELGIGGPANDFNPPMSIWAQDNPNAGNQWTVPTGVTLNQSYVDRVLGYSNPSTGFVHALHCGRWGSWVFAVGNASVNDDFSNVSLSFSRGGFQEARGCGTGGPFYISNILEELDDSEEYFIDSANHVLYYKPNATTGMPNNFVASQRPCIVSVVGTQSSPVVGVTITGVTFAHTSNTYMRDYMVPSGGDWSVHRGATLYVEGTEHFNVSGSHFNLLGSNGVLLFGYNNGTVIASNEMSWLGDSGIVLLGTTDGIDGVGNTQQPTLTTIISNHIHEIGIYIKQTAPIGQFLSRSSTIIGNVLYNAPRAGITFNDGFGGNHFVHANTIFNTVRETGDHGPFNSWDRQPYLTTALDGQTPSLTPAPNRIYLNLLFNSYSSIWPLDHDDGSCFYEDSYNVLIYGGYKNYLGHSKTVHHNLYVYPDSSRFDGPGTGTQWGTFCVEDSGPQPNASGWDESWFNNECHMAKSGIVYQLDNCDTDNLFVTNTANNTFYIPKNTSIDIPCQVNGISRDLTLEQYQKASGEDKGSVWYFEEPFAKILTKARTMLGLKTASESVGVKVGSAKSVVERAGNRGHRHARKPARAQ